MSWIIEDRPFITTPDTVGTLALPDLPDADNAPSAVASAAFFKYTDADISPEQSYGEINAHFFGLGYVDPPNETERSTFVPEFSFSKGTVSQNLNDGITYIHTFGFSKISQGISSVSFSANAANQPAQLTYMEFDARVQGQILSFLDLSLVVVAGGVDFVDFEVGEFGSLGLNTDLKMSTATFPNLGVNFLSFGVEFPRITAYSFMDMTTALFSQSGLSTLDFSINPVSQNLSTLSFGLQAGAGGTSSTEFGLSPLANQSLSTVRFSAVAADQKYSFLSLSSNVFDGGVSFQQLSAIATAQVRTFLNFAVNIAAIGLDTLSFRVPAAELRVNSQMEVGANVVSQINKLSKELGFSARVVDNSVIDYTLGGYGVELDSSIFDDPLFNEYVYGV